MAQKFPPAALYNENTEDQFQSLRLIFFPPDSLREREFLLCTPSLKNVFLYGKDGELIE